MHILDLTWELEQAEKRDRATRRWDGLFRFPGKCRVVKTERDI